MSKLSFTLRPAALSDAPLLASLASTSYLSSELSSLLYPTRYVYIQDHTHAYQQRILSRMGSPANLTLVATLPNGLPIGYAQFLRLGPGAPAATWESTLRGAYITATKWVEDNLWRFVDRSADVDALREFMHNKEGFWGDAPEEMWYVQSLVVGESWQRKGVGRVLMAEVLDRAKVEGVMVGLEASKEGEGLYRKLGFRLRRRFAEGDVCGGVMEWVPEGNRGGEDGEGQ